jgi:pimeloyl-ACP methyl ester carboxylesterase
MSTGAVIAGPQDAPPVMLIHGLGGSYRAWDRVMPFIERVARITAVHLGSTTSIEHDGNDAAGLIDTPTVLVGHSRGGLVATALAERHPRLVSKLILLCPSWSVASRRSAGRPIERALAIPGIGALLWAAASDAQRRAGLASAFAPGVAVPDRFVADLRDRGRANFVRSSRAIDDYLAVRPLVERLANVAVDIDLVFGELDARVALPRDEFAPLHHTHLTVLPGVGHSPSWEAPDTVAKLITHALRPTAAAP